ncbi:lysR substrate binding domain protein [Acinetobacter baumannii 83444]|nr:lysR substrate binding domain protein [Acinetobacter baumannii 83444]
MLGLCNKADAQVDLALRITQKVADGLIARPVCQIESVFCAHPDYLKQHSPLLHPRQLIQHECIAHHSQHQFEPYRVCRRVNILRDYPDDKTKLYPRN